MDMSRDYKVVDVFTQRPLLGNPVAVVLDAQGLDSDAMQAIARWTNLSETTFVLPPTEPEADYRLRIFTPRSELPFAGHPTLGSAHAILETGHIEPRDGGRLVQQCGVGLVELRVEGQGAGRRLAFGLPPARIAPLAAADVAQLETLIGCSLDGAVEPATVDVGPIWVLARLKDADQVLGLQPDFAKLAAFERRLGVTGLTVFGAHAQGDAAIEVRSFVPSSGIEEDPVCGSGNGCVAAFQRARGLLPADGHDYVAAQGGRTGRNGRVHVHVGADGQVRVGGACVTVAEGRLRL